MNNAPSDQRGLALGAWGAVQACAAGVGMATSGVIRDVVNTAAGTRDVLPFVSGPASGYTTVYAIEIVLLVLTIAAMAPIVFRFRQQVRA
jgi:MFS transporter, BCD family, chlorophyll transporter